MYKIINIGIPKYLTDVIPTHEIDYNIRNGTKTLLTAELKVLKIHFFHILLRLSIFQIDNYKFLIINYKL